MVGIYEIIKEKGGVNEDVGWIPEYLKVAVEHLEAWESKEVPLNVSMSIVRQNSECQQAP